MVVDGAQVEEMLLGEEGAAAGAPDGTLFIDCTTIAPADARRIGKTLTDAGHGFVDAPVTGSAPKAEDGTLTIMCGGSDADMERARPLLEAMGEKIVHAGEVGQGQAVKVISNSVSAINCAALAQALVVGRRADVDLEALLEVMGSGSANSTMLQLKGKPMLEHDFSPLFKLEHMLKDVGLCLDEARANGAPFPFAALARELYSAGRRPRPRRAGLRRGARGRRGPRRHPPLRSHWKLVWNRSSGIGPIRSNGPICRDIMSFRDFVHSM